MQEIKESIRLMTGEVKHFHQLIINHCNMSNVVYNVCTFLQTCEIAVLSTKLASVKLFF